MTAPSVEAVEVAVDDGVVLRGQRWAGNDGWVVLLHDCGEEEDLDRWAPLAPRLAARGWTVLAVDLRGHGASDGSWDPSRAERDVAAIVAFARAGGARFASVVAAGESALAALRSTTATKPDALVVLSVPLGPGEPLTELRGAGEAKLIVVGGGDPAMRTAAERLCKSAIGWVMLVNLPTTEQGTALLTGPAGARLVEQVTGYLAEQRFLARRRSDRPGVPRAGRGGAIGAREEGTEQG
jgi:pimeloyl-ACP methyl ester carboxylesterase